ncbi:MAG: hypothetical protein WCF85_20870 [Rhodospirillaceae bacterium]
MRYLMALAVAGTLLYNMDALDSIQRVVNAAGNLVSTVHAFNKAGTDSNDVTAYRATSGYAHVPLDAVTTGSYSGHFGR